LNRISVTGTRVPKLILDFDELKTEYNVLETLLNNMKNCGYVYPTPIQMQALPVMLQVSLFL
jgi:ATP-dependent RNA helicase DDX52/ROK1